jgi:hypothetical protein
VVRVVVLLHPSSTSARGIKYRVFIFSNVVLVAANVQSSGTRGE